MFNSSVSSLITSTLLPCLWAKYSLSTLHLVLFPDAGYPHIIMKGILFTKIAKTQKNLMRQQLSSCQISKLQNANFGRHIEMSAIWRLGVNLINLESLLHFSQSLFKNVSIFDWIYKNCINKITKGKCCLAWAFTDTVAKENTFTRQWTQFRNKLKLSLK